jgi:hypothetical protein
VYVNQAQLMMDRVLFAKNVIILVQNALALPSMNVVHVTRLLIENLTTGSIHAFAGMDTLTMDKIYANHAITRVYYAQAHVSLIAWTAVMLISEY